MVAAASKSLRSLEFYIKTDYWMIINYFPADIPQKLQNILSKLLLNINSILLPFLSIPEFQCEESFEIIDFLKLPI